MDEERSPFLIGTLVSGESFVDREWPRKHLRANFRSGINTVIISPRRWGKSSLIKQVVLDMSREKNVRFAFVDLFHVRTEQEFLERTTEAVIKALGKTMEQRMADVKEFIRGVVPQVSFGVDPQSEFSLKFDLPDGRRSMPDLLDLPERMAQAKGVRLVLCIDEFQNIAQLPDPTGFQKMLRASWQHQKAVCHAIYGSKRHMMTDLFNKQSMPFFRFGDILFLDSSHRSFQGSDVTVFFLDILPRVRPGVIIHIHDIYLPDDYISGHVSRMWNEQYLLATALLFGGDAFEILFPCWFVHRDPALSARANSALRRGPLEGVNLYGASFWLTKRA